MKKIYNAKDAIEARIICDMLMEEDIQNFCKEPGSGQYLSITTGASFCGTDIYINDEDEEAAREVVNEYLNNISDNMEDAEIKIPWYKNRTIVARIIILYALLMMLFVFIANLIN